MWNEQRDPNWSGPRDGGPWSGQSEPPPSWSGQYDQPPWSNQPDQPPWGQREPPFRMQRPPHFRGPFPPHQQPPPFNQPPPPHNFGRFPPRFMQDDFPPRHHFDRPPYPPHRFDYPQGDFPGGKQNKMSKWVECYMLHLGNLTSFTVQSRHRASSSSPPQPEDSASRNGGASAVGWQPAPGLRSPAPRVQWAVSPHASPRSCACQPRRPQSGTQRPLLRPSSRPNGSISKGASSSAQS